MLHRQRGCVANFQNCKHGAKLTSTLQGMKTSLLYRNKQGAFATWWLLINLGAAFDTKG